MNTANKLTVLRVCLIPVFIVLLLGNIMGPQSRYWAIFVFAAASLTDFLDGYIARSRNMVTNLGKFMDPLADKLLVASALIAMIELSLIPAWAVIIIIAREFIVTGFRLIASEKGIVIASDIWGKIKTTVQMVMIIFILFGFNGWDWLCTVLIWLSVVLSVISAADCIYKNVDVLKGK